MTIKKAVIPAAGKGTRFLPATKAVPKELLPIVDTPTLQHIVEEAVAAGIEDFLIISNRGKDAIIDHFDQDPALEDFLLAQAKEDLYRCITHIPQLGRFYFLRQKKAKGLGHAVAQAREFCGDEPFAVLLGDDVIKSEEPGIGQLIKAYERSGHGIIGVQKVAEDQVSKYGIVEPTSEPRDPSLFTLRGLIEKPEPAEAPSLYAVLGRYILSSEVFDILDSLPPGKDNEIQLTDALHILAQQGKLSACQLVGDRYDAGDKLGYLKANLAYAMDEPDLAAPLKDFMRDLLQDDAHANPFKHIPKEIYSE